MPLSRVAPLPVTVRFERRSTPSPWIGDAWKLCAVEPAADGAALAIEVHRDEAEGYYLNVTSTEPSIFVMWRLEEGDDAPRALAVTVSYNEAGRWMDGGETVERVSMPSEMSAWLGEYVALHYRPEQGRKRRGSKPSFMKRDEFDAMARREAGETPSGGHDGSEPAR